VSATVVEARGATLPRIGFGTWLLYGPAATDGVRDALELGYRNVDTARFYENEIRVGMGIAESGVPREQIFLTSKVLLSPVWSARPDRARVARPDALRWETEDALRWETEDSLMKLDTDYLDLLLLHWPDPDVPLERTLATMVALREEGLIRQLGVSNFPPGMLRAACKLAPVFCNQVEYHPFLSQERLLDAARELDVLVTAHTPLARGRVTSDETLARIGARHGRTAIQVALRWLVEQDGVSVAAAATTHEWRVDNLAIFDFELTNDDRAEIARLPKDGRVVEPPWAPDWDA